MGYNLLSSYKNIKTYNHLQSENQVINKLQPNYNHFIAILKNRGHHSGSPTQEPHPAEWGAPPGRVGVPPGRVGVPPSRVGVPPNRVGVPPGRVGAHTRPSGSPARPSGSHTQASAVRSAAVITEL